MKKLILTALIFFLSPVLIFAQQDSSTVDTDTTLKIFEKVEVEASYPGGVDAWKKFLEKNLNGSITIENDAPAGIYTVMIQFIVDKNGKASNIRPLTKLGYGMEQEVVRVLSKSGNWLPAMMNGAPVKAYRKQPVTFMSIDDDFEIETTTPYILYTRTDNPVTVTVKKVKPEDIVVTITGGHITSVGEGRYLVKVNKPGRVIIQLYNGKKNKDIGSASFEVREKTN